MLMVGVLYFRCTVVWKWAHGKAQRNLGEVAVTLNAVNRVSTSQLLHLIRFGDTIARSSDEGERKRYIKFFKIENAIVRDVCVFMHTQQRNKTQNSVVCSGNNEECDVE